MSAETIKSKCDQLRKEIEEVKQQVKVFRNQGFTEEVGDPAEVRANTMLAFRHLEDARMRLGKAIQAAGSGTSKYDQP